MIPAIESKRIALAEYKRTPSQKNLLTLRAARGKVQQMARLCANEYWQELSETIQRAAISDNTKSITLTVSALDAIECLQEKCREQQMPLYISFIDLTKAFDLVSRDRLFKILPKIGCCYLLFAYDAVVTHTQEELQTLMNRFSMA
uniref:Reverse transcriptase domain-containing protein n=1 Tax=Magallana gigas TaxID=29159 RepID=A0A8W8MLL7_MAGGI